MNKIVKNTLILTLITVIAGFLLGAVYETHPKIRAWPVSGKDKERSMAGGIFRCEA